jgi:hypothetical protein
MAVTCNLLQENGSKLLQEDSSRLLIENCVEVADTNIGGRIVGGTFSRGRWRKLRDELYREYERDPVRIAARAAKLEERRQRRQAAQDARNERERKLAAEFEAELTAEAARNAAEVAKVVGEIRAKTESFESAAKKLQDSALFAAMATAALGRIRAERQAELAPKIAAAIRKKVVDAIFRRLADMAMVQEWKSRFDDEDMIILLMMDD